MVVIAQFDLLLDEYKEVMVWFGIPANFNPLNFGWHLLKDGGGGGRRQIESDRSLWRGMCDHMLYHDRHFWWKQGLYTVK